MAVKIKLKRMGKIHASYYRVVVADARSKRDGRAIEEIGKYHPKLEPSLIEINSERAQYWLSVGAQPTDPVRNLLKITGDWQRFRGEEGVEGTVKTGAPAPDKKEAFAAALKETHGEAEGAATTQKGRARKAEAKADKPEARSAKPDKPGKAAAETGEAKGEAGKARARKAQGGGDAAAAKAPAKPAKADNASGEADKAGAATAGPDQAGDGKADGGAARKRAAAGKADATAGAEAADEAGNGA